MRREASMIFSEEMLEKDKIQCENWQSQCSKLYGDSEFEATTKSGIRVKPAYGPTDIADISPGDLVLPGEYPYTRGTFPLRYQVRPWMNQQLLGYGLPEQTRQRMDFMTAEGQTWLPGQEAYSIIVDITTQKGYDPGDPEARGRVGICGVSLSTVDDLAILWDGKDLRKTFVNYVAFDPSIVILAMHIVAAERRGVPQQELLGEVQNTLYRGWYFDDIMFPPRGAFKLMVELIKYCTGNMPQWNTTNIDEYEMAEAGANPVQALAFAVATYMAITEECLKAGLKPDDFLPKFFWHAGLGNDFFEEIAKFRALRRMWAKINKERFGCQDPKSLRARVFIDTLGSTMTAQQPLNNIVRTTLQTLAAAFSDATSIDTCPYDEAFNIPTEQAEMISLRTKQILLHETNIPNVTDPLGGSYYVEWLTNRVEEEAYKLIQQVEERGGYIKCWEDGWFRQEIMQTANKWRADLESGQEIVVGVNKYVVPEEQVVPLFEYPTEAEEIAIERVKAHKQRRDNARTKAALNGLREEAERVDRGDGYLMPALIEAARAEATLREMMDVLREVFGWGYTW
jgi:methylmalonyl-CoA mutase N-terminal domain/subunit